jgi:hypothetical protein
LTLGSNYAPLSGLTVLEFLVSVAARYCERLFAAQGARVLQARVPSESGVGMGEQRAWLLRDGFDHGKAAYSALDRIDIDLVVSNGTAADFPNALHLSLSWFDRRGPRRDWVGTDALI